MKCILTGVAGANPVIPGIPGNPDKIEAAMLSNVRGAI